MSGKKVAQAASLAWVQQYWPLLQFVFYKTSAPFGYNYARPESANESDNTTHQQKWLAYQVLFNALLNSENKLADDYDTKKSNRRKDVLAYATKKLNLFQLEKVGNPARKDAARDTLLQSAPNSAHLAAECSKYEKTCKQSRLFCRAAYGVLLGGLSFMTVTGITLGILGALGISVSAIGMGIPVIAAFMAIILATAAVTLGLSLKNNHLENTANEIESGLLQPTAITTVQSEMLCNMAGANTQDPTADVASTVSSSTTTALGQMGGSVAANTGAAPAVTSAPVDDAASVSNASSSATTSSATTSRRLVVVSAPISTTASPFRAPITSTSLSDDDNDGASVAAATGSATSSSTPAHSPHTPSPVVSMSPNA